MANRLLFILILLGIGIKAHSQYYLDMKEDAVRLKAYAENNTDLKITKTYNKHGYKYLSWTNIDNTFKIYVAFNSSGYSTMVIFEPVQQDLLSTYIETYNNKFVKISDTEWKDYVLNKVIDFKLRYGESNNSYYFQITRSQ